MNRFQAGFFVASIFVGAMSCASERVPPKSLVDARANYAHAREGIASRYAPATLRDAGIALDDAEQAWHDAPDDPRTAYLAAVAEHKISIAESQAMALKTEQDAYRAAAGRLALRSAPVQRLPAEPAEPRMGVTQLQPQEPHAFAASEHANGPPQQLEALAKIDAVKQDARGTVVTLASDELFPPGKAELKAGALGKLEQVARVLEGRPGEILVCGYTDNEGALDRSVDLSYRRARAVGDFLVKKGIPREVVSAQGKGPEDPVTDNRSAEGRARNRRLEIVIHPGSEP